MSKRVWQKRSAIVSAALILALGVALAWWFTTRPSEEGVLEANGQVRGTEVTLSAKVPGTAEVVAVKEGQSVQRGDLVAQVGAREVEARFAQAAAERDAARSRLGELSAQVRALDAAIEQSRLGVDLARGTSQHEIHGASESLQRADADVAAAEAQWQQDQRLVERYRTLADQGFVSRNYYDDIRTRLQTSESRLAAARRAREEAVAASQRAQANSLGVDVKRQDVQRLRAERERLILSRTTLERQAEASGARVAEVEATLSDLRIVAPSNGTVINRLVEPGELVVAGRPLVTIIDLSALYVRVFIPESDLGKVRLGNPARAYTDAFPERAFTGRVVEVAQQAEFTPKEAHVRDERQKLVYAVKVALENPEGYLKPGMSVDVKIRWKDDARW